MSGCHAPCDTDSNNSFFDGNEEMGVRFPPTQLIRISVLKPNMERWRDGRRGSYVQYVMFVALTAIYYSLGPASLMVQIHPSPFKAMAQMSLQIKKMRQLHEVMGAFTEAMKTAGFGEEAEEPPKNGGKKTKAATE